MEKLLKECENIKKWLINVRRDIHKTAELSEKEYDTKKKIIKYLDEIGLEYKTFKNHNGVMAYILNEKATKTIALRADIDALPILEKNNKSYKSINKGIMHACGHDAHTTILLGVCKILYLIKDSLNINIKFLFQPAEETVGGARFLIEDKCLENPKVDYIFGLHVNPSIDTGYIETKYNILNASTDEIYINIKGKKAHGAYPENGNDALITCAQVITSLQSIISRNISPIDSAVLTIGTINGGSAQNIICDDINMHGTLRTLNPKTRELIIKRITSIVENTSKSFDCSGTVTLGKYGYPPVVNDKELVDIVIANTKKLLGDDKLLIKDAPSLGGEDFSFYTETCKGVFFHLGCKNEDKGITAQLHTSEFDIDEECLPIGVMIQLMNALKFNCE